MERDTRTRLLEAAIAAIDTGGEASLRVADIAAAAGVREPSVYHFFGSRAGLVEAAQAMRYGDAQAMGIERFARAVELCRNREEFERAVQDALRWTFGAERRASRSARASVLGSALTRERLREHLLAVQRSINESLAEVFRTARDRGWTRPDLEPMAAAVWIVSQINGRLFIEMDPDHYDGEEWNVIAIRATLAGLRGGESGGDAI